MRLVIAGGHGQIALRLTRLLAARGDDVVGLVRNPAHTAEVEAAGARAAVVDLEHADVQELAATLEGADAVVFAAGAGPGSGAERKDSMDRGGAALLAEAAEQVGARRYVLISALGVDQADASDDDVFAAYLRAKAASEADLRSRDLDWTVLRPGRLTDAPGTGAVRLEPQLDPGARAGEISRDDVAAVVVAVLDEPASTGLTLELVGGDDLVDAAVQAAARGEEGDGSVSAVLD